MGQAGSRLGQGGCAQAPWGVRGFKETADKAEFWKKMGKTFDMGFDMGFF